VESGRFGVEVGRAAKARSGGDLFYIGRDETVRVEQERRTLKDKTPSGTTVGNP
jgi:hypothetical protein